ncbi:RNA 2',3'-cyclic phosphodiesterase [Streptomyces sp. NPDC088354]|uniref:RNA 2',3'-cyclic phosphodiesterase n=1 Tax=unclassified Streptomyces TaxID=2593676 RepID=UPI0029A231F7|nr:RNA 2',3'-cyclic phosphodiesterase [Streptomyces sp. MI02-7b]MDX3076040.1 RNA 2',3'-cyclic phosphodiesterase [Streptomyces sp. MI02-7b]
MRLFVAVVPPRAALAELGAAVDALRALPDADGLRWTERAGWHVTLAFLGEVGPDLVPGLVERLDRAARRHQPYRAGLAGGGRFGDRTLWAGLDEAGPDGDLGRDGRSTARLAEAAQAAARRAGVSYEDEHGRFHAHLTLARQRGNRGRVGLRPFTDALGAFRGTVWTADAIALVRSHPPAPGVPGAQPRYERLRTCPLGH